MVPELANAQQENQSLSNLENGFTDAGSQRTATLPPPPFDLTAESSGSGDGDPSSGLSSHSGAGQGGAGAEMPPNDNQIALRSSIPTPFSSNQSLTDGLPGRISLSGGIQDLQAKMQQAIKAAKISRLVEELKQSPSVFKEVDKVREILSLAEAINPEAVVKKWSSVSMGLTRFSNFRNDPKITPDLLDNEQDGLNKDLLGIESLIKAETPPLYARAIAPLADPAIHLRNKLSLGAKQANRFSYFPNQVWRVHMRIVMTLFALLPDLPGIPSPPARNLGDLLTGLFETLDNVALDYLDQNILGLFFKYSNGEVVDDPDLRAEAQNHADSIRLSSSLESTLPRLAERRFFIESDAGAVLSGLGDAVSTVYRDIKYLIGMLEASNNSIPENQRATFHPEVAKAQSNFQSLATNIESITSDNIFFDALIDIDTDWEYDVDVNREIPWDNPETSTEPEDFPELLESPYAMAASTIGGAIGGGFGGIGGIIGGIGGGFGGIGNIIGGIGGGFRGGFGDKIPGLGQNNPEAKLDDLLDDEAHNVLAYLADGVVDHEAIAATFMTDDTYRHLQYLKDEDDAAFNALIESELGKHGLLGKGEEITLAFQLEVHSPDIIIGLPTVQTKSLGFLGGLGSFLPIPRPNLPLPIPVGPGSFLPIPGVPLPGFPFPLNPFPMPSTGDAPKQNSGSHGLSHWREKAQNFIHGAASYTLEHIVKAFGQRGEEVWNWIKQEEEVLKLIADDPRGFMENLGSTLKAGFVQFGGNIGTHLQTGVYEWLFGAVSSAGITIPDSWTNPKDIFILITEILGLTYDNIRLRLIENHGIPEETIEAAETAGGVLKDLTTEGFAGLWEQAKTFASNIPGMIFGYIQGEITKYVQFKLIQAGAEKMLAAIIPGAGFLEAIKEIYEFVKWLMDQAQQLLDFVNMVTGVVGDIAKGQTSGLSDTIETALASMISPMLSLVSNLLGLDVANSIQRGVNHVQDLVWEQLDPVLDYILPTNSIDHSEDIDYEDHTTEESADKTIRDAAYEPIRIGDEVHHVEVRILNGEPFFGVASEWDKLVNIWDAIKDHIPQGERGTHQTEVTRISGTLKPAVANQRALLVGLNPPASTEPENTKKRKYDQIEEAREELSKRSKTCSDALKNLMTTLKQNYREVIEEHFNGQALFFGSPNQVGDPGRMAEYKTGKTQAEAIPIIWYKDPTKYAELAPKGTDDWVGIGTKLELKDRSDKTQTYNLADTNILRRGRVLKKLRKQDQRKESAKMRDLLNFNNYKARTGAIKGWSSHDIDHIRDLGFGGSDAKNNLWPLDSVTNQFAYTRYNSNYVLSYKTKKSDGTDELKSTTIGALRNKFIKIKSIKHGAMPSESNTADAGTDVVASGD